MRSDGFLNWQRSKQREIRDGRPAKRRDYERARLRPATRDRLLDWTVRRPRTRHPAARSAPPSTPPGVARSSCSRSVAELPLRAYRRASCSGIRPPSRSKRFPLEVRFHLSLPRDSREASDGIQNDRYGRCQRQPLSTPHYTGDRAGLGLAEPYPRPESCVRQPSAYTCGTGICSPEPNIAFDRVTVPGAA